MWFLVTSVSRELPPALDWLQEPHLSGNEGIQGQGRPGEDVPRGLGSGKWRTNSSERASE